MGIRDAGSQHSLVTAHNTSHEHTITDTLSSYRVTRPPLSALSAVPREVHAPATPADTPQGSRAVPRGADDTFFLTATVLASPTLTSCALMMGAPGSGERPTPLPRV